MSSPNQARRSSSPCLALAVAALSPAPVASASTEKTHTVDATMKIAIIESSKSANHFVGRFTGKPGGTAAVLGVASITSTPTGLVTKSQPTLYERRAR